MTHMASPETSSPLSVTTSAVAESGSSAAAGAVRPFITVRHLHKRYGQGAPILDDVSLEVASGDFISLIGPSGCGKSTLLKLVAGLTPVSQGTIEVDGMTPANGRELMSFIFQDATLLPWRTVLGNIELGLELEGSMNAARRHEKAGDLLKLVGLSNVARHYPRQLSGGMKMRVSIARALATRPRLLLMDEPFGALDEMTRDRLNEEILRLRSEQGWTALFVTHSVAEAVFLSTRIVVLQANPGRIRRDIPVPFPFPRTAALRSDPAFLALVGEVSHALRELNRGLHGKDSET
jgi:NitT/TauT family transport system ATP-binding protein